MIGIFFILTIFSNYVNADDYGYNNYLNNLENEESSITSNGTSGGGSNSTYNETYDTWLPNYTAYHDFWYNQSLSFYTFYNGFNYNYNQSDSIWHYNMSDGSYNITYQNYAYNQTGNYNYNQTYTGGTYNITYALWAYNQTCTTCGSTYNETYDTWFPNYTAFSKYWYNMTYTGGTYNSTYDKWAYNMSDGGADGSYNSTYAQYAYNQSDGSYNVTYNTWAYNMTTLGDYNYNESSWLISEYGKWWYNFTLADIWMYNMSDGSYNSTYAIWAYNQSDSIWHYNMSDGGADGSYNITYDTWSYNQSDGSYNTSYVQKGVDNDTITLNIANITGNDLNSCGADFVNQVNFINGDIQTSCGVPSSSMDYTNIALENRTNIFQQPQNITNGSRYMIIGKYEIAGAEGFSIRSTSDIILYPRQTSPGGLLPYDDGYVTLGTSFYRFLTLYLKKGIEFRCDAGNCGWIGTQNNKQALNFTSDNNLDININLSIKNNLSAHEISSTNFSGLGSSITGIPQWEIVNNWLQNNTFRANATFNALSFFNNNIYAFNNTMFFGNGTDDLTQQLASISWNNLADNGGQLEINTNLVSNNVTLHDHAYGSMYENNPLPLVGAPPNVFVQVPLTNQGLYDNINYAGNQLICDVSGRYKIDWSISLEDTTVPPPVAPTIMDFAVFVNGVQQVDGMCSVEMTLQTPTRYNCGGTLIVDCPLGGIVDLQFNPTNTMNFMGTEFYGNLNIVRVGSI